MSVPERLLDGGEATEFERSLLEAARGERPSARLQHQIQQGIGLGGPAVWLTGVRASLSTASGKLGAAAVGVALVGAAGTSLVLQRSSAPAPDQRVESPSAAPLLAEPIAQSHGAPEDLANKQVSSKPAEHLEAPELTPEKTASQKEASNKGRGSLSGKADRGELGLVDVDAVEVIGEHGLREEIRRIDGVRRALQAGNETAAVELLRAYERRFPQGVLKTEAQTLRGRLSR